MNNKELLLEIVSGVLFLALLYPLAVLLLAF